MHIEITKLPSHIQRALKEVGYHRKDIGVSASDTYTMNVGGGQGVQGFIMCVDMGTGFYEIKWGSWGGANMFNPTNQVDLDSNSRPLPPNFAVIKGTKSDTVKYASIQVNPATLAPLLPAKADITDKEARILAVFRSIKGGYRKEYLERLKATESEIISLADKGFLKRSKNGATQITTDGRNACAHIK